MAEVQYNINSKILVDVKNLTSLFKYAVLDTNCLSLWRL